MSMEEQSQKNRSGTESQREELIKRPKADDDDDDDDDDCEDFYLEADTDSESDDDFTNPYHILEADRWYTESTLWYDEEKVEDRRCLDVPLCHKNQHKEEFKGLPLFELFKVRVRINENYDNYNGTPLRGRLHGEIVTFPSKYDQFNPKPICYYSASSVEAVEICLDVDNKFARLPISGPKPRPAICEGNTLALDFAFKIDGEDVFHIGQDHKNPQLFGGDASCKAACMILSPSYSRCSRDEGLWVARKLVGEQSFDPVRMGVYYSAYYGSWATIDIKVLDMDIKRVSGLIVARPCIFYSRIRLLSIEEGRYVEVGHAKSGLINLTRSVVAVPSYASLIIGAALYDEGEKLICRGKIAFPAKESGEETRGICYNGVETLQVRVEWKCKV